MFCLRLCSKTASENNVTNTFAQHNVARVHDLRIHEHLGDTLRREDGRQQGISLRRVTGLGLHGSAELVTDLLPDLLLRAEDLAPLARKKACC